MYMSNGERRVLCSSKTSSLVVLRFSLGSSVKRHELARLSLAASGVRQVGSHLSARIKQSLAGQAVVHRPTGRQHSRPNQRDNHEVTSGVSIPNE